MRHFVPAMDVLALAAHRAEVEQRAMGSSRVQAALRRSKRREKQEASARERRTARWAAIVSEYRSGTLSPSTAAEARRLSLEGVPSNMREVVWPMLIGNSSQITAELYRIQCERVATLLPRVYALRAAETRATTARLHAQYRDRSKSRATDASSRADSPAPAAAEPPLFADEVDPALLSVPISPTAAQPISDDASSPRGVPPVQPDAVSRGSGDDEASRVSNGPASPVVKDDDEAVVKDDDGAVVKEDDGAVVKEDDGAVVKEDDEAAVKDDDTSVVTDAPVTTDTTSLAVVGNERSLLHIELDLSRTFPELAFFREDGPLRGPLQRILSAYVAFRPDVGYVQGQSFVAAALLLHVIDEPTAFICYANIMARRHVFDAFRSFTAEAHARMRAFQRAFRACDPDLAAHLAAHEVMPEMYLPRWIMTLFTYGLPLELAARIWDAYFCHGESFLWRVCAGLLVSLRRQLLAADSDGIMHLLSDLRTIWQPDHHRVGAGRASVASDLESRASFDVDDAASVVSDATAATAPSADSETAEAEERILAALTADDDPFAPSVVLRNVDRCSFDDSLFDKCFREELAAGTTTATAGTPATSMAPGLMEAAAAAGTAESGAGSAASGSWVRWLLGFG